MNQSIYTEYSNLTPDKIQWLDGCGAVWVLGQKFSEISNVNKFIWFDHVFSRKQFSYGKAGNEGTHIPTGSEFCERVAEILGIDKPVFASDLKDKLVKKLEMHDRMERPLPEGEGELLNDAFFDNDSSNTMSPDEVDAIIQSIASPQTYPHRTYRVLDSLDGIPFDKRIPLSEWIPPFLKIVLLITEDDQVIGQLTKIIENEIWFNCSFKNKIIPLDGHWMRIV